jgi:hypothetical protein
VVAAAVVAAGLPPAAMASAMVSSWLFIVRFFYLWFLLVSPLEEEPLACSGGL